MITSRKYSQSMVFIKEYLDIFRGSNERDEKEARARPVSPCFPGLHCVRTVHRFVCKCTTCTAEDESSYVRAGVRMSLRLQDAEEEERNARKHFLFYSRNPDAESTESQYEIL